MDNFYNIKMTKNDFVRMSEFIYNQYGIKMPPGKKIMLQARLQKRLRALNITSFKNYCDFVFSKEGEQKEVINMIDVVSTNKTDFFREPVHFDFMLENFLPEYVSNGSANKKLKVWCAGCSSGEEAYTIAITLSEFVREHPGFDYFIYGTDISKKMLTKAIDAIYQEKRVEGIPLDIKKRYLLKSKDQIEKKVRFVPSLRSKIHFERMNFMDEEFNVKEIFDVIFCRNVLIYFDRITQEKVINKLCSKLKTGGYLFLGHSESIMNLDVPLDQVKPAIFRRI